MTVLSKPLPDTTHRILCAAEVAFAEHGFDGTGMKAISLGAGVSQALLHYHFGSKDHLYAEVVRHRSRMINNEREALLARVDLSAPDALERILDALFRPPLGPSGGDRAYVRIFGGLIVGRERERLLVQECYDPTARRFIAALGKVLPGASREMAALCYTMALGGLVTLISRDGRLERLGDQEQLTDIEDLLVSLTDFASAGMRGLVAHHSTDQREDKI